MEILTTLADSRGLYKNVSQIIVLHFFPGRNPQMDKTQRKMPNFFSPSGSNDNIFFGINTCLQ